MDILPDEVLMMIFEFLTSQEALTGPFQVCRRWARLCGLRILQVKHRLDVERLRVGIRSVFIMTRIDSLIDFVNKTAGICTNLRELTVHSTMLFGNGHLNALSKLRLRHLDIFIDGRVCDRRMLPVATELSSLVINESVSPGFFSELSKRSSFRSLQMFGRALYYPRAELLKLLRVRGTHLTDLTLRCPELTEPAYKAIGDCANLTSLQLYSCWMMTGGAALHVVRPPRLRRLHITGSFMVRTLSLGSLINQVPGGVRELVLSSSCFGDEHINTLTKRLKHLRMLELWRCRMSPKGAKQLALASPSLQDLDLDLELTDSEICGFSKVPHLKRLRCRPKTKTDKGQKSFMCHKLHVTSTYTRYACKYFRGGGEGFRANLFYYSIQDRKLDELPPNSNADWFEENPYF